MSTVARWLALALTAVALSGGTGEAAPKPEPWARWEAHDDGSGLRVDHSPWDRLLRQLTVTNHPSGIHRVRYAAATAEDRKALAGYVASLERAPVSRLSRPEQKAYWVNLYNALTVRVVLDHYPVGSIRDVRSGWLKPGPWDLTLAQVEGVELTLNDIEHRILRPLFRDNRVHYALNCASLGCPNLQPEAFTAENTERLLETGAREYVNHPRGALLRGDTLVASSIYDWFQEDFGGSEEGVLRHLAKYADAPLAAALRAFRGRVSHGYDWGLNE